MLLKRGRSRICLSISLLCVHVMSALGQTALAHTTNHVNPTFEGKDVKCCYSRFCRYPNNTRPDKRLLMQVEMVPVSKNIVHLLRTTVE